MRALVLNERRPEREAMVRALQAASCSVETVADVKAAMAAIASRAPQVVVFSWPARGGADLVRLLRGADASGEAYLLAVLDPTPGGGDVGPCLAAGVQDFMRRPIVEAELVARVLGPGRMVLWAKGLASSTISDLSGGVKMTGFAVWRNLGTIVAEDLGQMIGQAPALTSGWPSKMGRKVRAGTIAMSLASDQTELRVSVAGDAVTYAWLGETLLGDPRAALAAIDDVLREFANTAGGAVKRAALPEGISLTTGIPFTETTVRVGGDGFQSFGLALDGGKASLAIVGEVRSRENQRVPAAALSEGMVLVHDLRSQNGALLVTAGTRLTANAVGQLVRLLGPRFMVEVACVA